MFNALLEIVFGNKSVAFYNGINIVGTTASLIGYCWAKNNAWKITFTCLYVLFSIPLITLNTADWIYDEVPYFLPSLIQGVIVVIPLYLIGIIAKKTKQYK